MTSIRIEAPEGFAFSPHVHAGCRERKLDLEGIPSFYIVSFHTSGKHGAGYEHEVPPFMQGVRDLGYADRAIVLDYPMPEDDPLNWRRSTMLKPRVCRWAYENLPANILWLDIDARLRAPLDYFETWDDEIDAGFGIRKRPANGRQFWCSGTLFFQQIHRTDVRRKYLACSAVDTLLAYWARGCGQAARCQGLYAGAEGDQDVLGMVAHPLIENGHLSWVDLPPEYCFIFDIDRKRHPGVEPIVEHMQASRRRAAGREAKHR